MPYSIQKTWDKFERWQLRYKKVCYRTIDEMLDWENSDCLEDGLFIASWVDLGLDLFFEQGFSEQDLEKRVLNKINFLNAYLVDVSFDGAEFMSKKSNFLTAQYPSRCHDSFGVWMEQYLERDDGSSIESGASMSFQGFDASFFCKSISDVDLASMRNIIPFDRIFILRPHEESWDRKSIKSIYHKVKEDLEADFIVQIQVDNNENGPLLMMEFTWEV